MRAKFIQANWQKIWEEVTPYLASFDSIRQPMVTAGCPVTLEAIHRTPEEGVEALLYGSRYRTRYTLLDLAWVVVLRWRMGKPFYVGDTNHLSHRLTRRGCSRVQAVLLIWLLAAALGALAFVWQ